MSPRWRLQLSAILVAAVALRALFFVGFGLGDDLAYIAHADQILSGGYPPLDPLNQYAYRPLLLLLFAAGSGSSATPTSASSRQCSWRPSRPRR